MARDAALVLDTGQTVAADGSTTPIECEGGFPAWVTLLLGALAGGTSLDVRVQGSPDAGANYYKLGQFQRLVPTDDNKELRILVYVPRPATAGNKYLVRVNYDDTGGGSWAIAGIYLEPMTSLAPPAVDEQGVIGAAARVNAN